MHGDGVSVPGGGVPVPGGGVSVPGGGVSASVKSRVSGSDTRWLHFPSKFSREI